jgi:spermidine/putrescine transport system substrate-binding protein
MTVTSVFVAPSNRGALALLPPELRNDPVLIPSPEKLKKHEMIEDLGEALEQWDRVWTEVKAAN